MGKYAVTVIVDSTTVFGIPEALRTRVTTATSSFALLNDIIKIEPLDDDARESFDQGKALLS